MKGLLAIAAVIFSTFILTNINVSESFAMKNGNHLLKDKPVSYPTAVLAGGCFWCV